MNEQLAKEVLSSIIDFSRYKPTHKPQKDWTCKSCGTSNFASRVCCKACKAEKGKQLKELEPRPKKEGAVRQRASTSQVAPPWMLPEERDKRLRQLQEALEAARGAGAKKVVEEIEKEVKMHMKSKDKAEQGSGLIGVEAKRALL